MSDFEIKSFCMEKGVKITAQRQGLTYPPFWGNTQAHHWKVRIQRGRKSITIDYYMGLALTEEPKYDVLACLDSDAWGAKNSMDYVDFGREYGYIMESEEDLKHVMKVYKACLKVDKQLDHIFTPAERDELSEAVQDY